MSVNPHRFGYTQLVHVERVLTDVHYRVAELLELTYGDPEVYGAIMNLCVVINQKTRGVSDRREQRFPHHGR